MKKNPLSEKDKVKFNLQDKKSVKLTKAHIEENKKKNLRKNLMINSQLNPAASSNTRPSHYSNIKSTVRQHFGSPSKQTSPDVVYSNSPLNFNKLRVHQDPLSLSIGFKLHNANDRESKYINPNPNILVKLDRSRSSFKSNKILKQVSMNMLEDLANNNTAFNTINSLATNIANTKQKRIKSTEQMQMIDGRLSNKSDKRLNNCLQVKNSNSLKNSCDNLAKSFKINNNYNSDDSSINSSSKSINIKSTFSKPSSTCNGNLSPIKIKKSSHIIFVDDEKEKTPTKKVQNGMGFLAQAAKTKLRNSSMKIQQNEMLTAAKQKFGAKSTDFNSGGRSELLINMDNSKPDIDTNRSLSKSRKDLKRSNDKLSMINPEAQTWSYYSDKYLRYLFTGKILKFKEALVCKEKNILNSVIGYSCNINKGTMRDYNEDTVVTILSLPKPKTKVLELGVEWPSISYFAIFDGHGGGNVSEWLSENLHNYIVNQITFPKDIHTSIKQGFKEAEENLLIKLSNNLLGAEHRLKQKHSLTQNLDKKHDTSGSCAIVVIIIEGVCYVANLGDSRGLLSSSGLTECYSITRDHKPEDIDEKRRIEENGGKLWRQNRQDKSCPLRVIPGGLSVSI